MAMAMAMPGSYSNKSNHAMYPSRSQSLSRSLDHQHHNHTSSLSLLTGTTYSNTSRDVDTGSETPGPGRSLSLSLSHEIALDHDRSAQTSRSHSDSGSKTSRSRRPGRKLPPALTESLIQLNLEVFTKPASALDQAQADESPKSPLTTIEMLPIPSYADQKPAQVNDGSESSDMDTPIAINTPTPPSPVVDLDLEAFLRRGSNESASSSSSVSSLNSLPVKPQHTLAVAPPSEVFGAAHYSYIPPHAGNRSYTAGSVARKRPITTESDARIEAISRVPSVHASPASAFSVQLQDKPGSSSSLSLRSKKAKPKSKAKELKLSISPPITWPTSDDHTPSSSARPTSSSSSTSAPASHPTSTSRSPPSDTFSLRQSIASQTPTVPSLAAPSANSTASSAGPCTASACSIIEEYHPTTSPSSGLSRQGIKESRKERKARKKWEEEHFDIDTPPSLKELFEASYMEVRDERGGRFKFGDLIRERKTIVVFIRHWFCPLCAQYMSSIVSTVTPHALEQAGVNLIIIGNGSYKMLDGYKNKAFKCPFPMYTDPTLSLYRALGLTRQTASGGPDNLAGSYLVQSPLESTLQTIKRATQMPLRNPGHFTQIGGEFVFDGPLNPVFTHRMTSTRDHVPIEDVCAAAGMRLEFIHYEPGPRPPPVHRHSGTDSESEGQWRKDRDGVRDEIMKKREARRSGAKGRVMIVEPESGHGHGQYGEESEEGMGSYDPEDQDTDGAGMERVLAGMRGVVVA